MSSKKRILTVKIGTSSLTSGGPSLNRKWMVEIVRQLVQLKEKGWHIVLITSGAIAAGKELLKGIEMAKSVPIKQMLASIGQVELMQSWRALFAIWSITIGQVLLTRGDLSERERYLNIRDTLEALIAQGIIPVINENDTVATEEIKVGDNDNLGALVANLVSADLFIILTDCEGLLEADPKKFPDAALIPLVTKIDDSLFELVRGGAGSQGTGGMATKLQAAKLAVQGGTTTVIASATQSDILIKLCEGQRIGTTFLPQTTPKESRKRWLLAEKVVGSLEVDEGAAKNIAARGASLLPAGVKKVVSAKAFERGASVNIVKQSGEAIAVGLTNYSSEEIKRIAGSHSKTIAECLGYSYGAEIIHRDNMVLINTD